MRKPNREIAALLATLMAAIGGCSSNVPSMLTPTNILEIDVMPIDPNVEVSVMLEGGATGTPTESIVDKWGINHRVFSFGSGSLAWKSNATMSLTATVRLHRTETDLCLRDYSWYFSRIDTGAHIQSARHRDGIQQIGAPTGPMGRSYSADWAADGSYLGDNIPSWGPFAYSDGRQALVACP